MPITVEQREKYNTQRRNRYATDPEVRVQAVARAKEYAERPGVRDKRVRRLGRKHVEYQLILWGIKKESGCVHCGEFDPQVLDFHHRDPATKVGKLATLSTRKWSEVVEKELEKCDVLCANCHARQHRRDWGALFESEEL